MNALLLLALLGPSPVIVPPPHDSAPSGVKSTGACATQVTGDVVCYDNNGAAGGQRTANNAPQGLMLRSQPAFPGGAQTASNVLLCGGQDETAIAIDGADTCNAGDTVTATVVDSNGTSTATVLTYGTEWCAGAGCANQAARVTALTAAVEALAGVGSTESGTSALVTLDTSTCSVTLAESDAGCTTVSTGTDGFVSLQRRMRGISGSQTLPTYSFAADTGTGMYLNAAGSLRLGVSGASQINIQATSTTIGADLIVSGANSDISNDAANLRITDTLEVTGGLAKGALTTVSMVTQSLTFAANPGDATKVTSGLVPDGAMLLGVTTRVTTTATNCTSVSIGDGTDVDMFGATTGITQTTTTTNADATAQFGRSPATAAMEVTITANGGNCFSGVWAVTAHYILPTAATSN